MKPVIAKGVVVVAVLRVRVALPVLVMVMVRDPVLPMVTSPNAMDVGDTASTGAGAGVPLPVRGTVAVPALLVMVRFAAAEPVAVGVKTTVAVVVLPGATLVPGVKPVIANGVVVVAVLRVRVALPVLVMVTVRDPVLPMVMSPNATDAGVTDSTGAGVEPPTDTLTLETACCCA